MTPRTRLRDCDDEIVSGRLNKAEQFLEVAAMARDLADDEEDVGDAVVTLCVHAGIAAADVISCKALGHFVQGQDHLQAIAELSKVTADQRKRAFRRAEALVATARSRHAS